MMAGLLAVAAEIECRRDIPGVWRHWQMRKVVNGTVSVSVPGRDGLTGHSFGNLFLTA